MAELTEEIKSILDEGLKALDIYSETGSRTAFKNVAAQCEEFRNRNAEVPVLTTEHLIAYVKKLSEQDQLTAHIHELSEYPDIDFKARAEKRAKEIYEEDDCLVLNFMYPYAIDFEQIDMPQTILHWVRHLSEKTWMDAERLARFTLIAFERIGYKAS